MHDATPGKPVISWMLIDPPEMASRPDPTFQCYGCDGVMKRGYLALVCMCGGHYGVCVGCYDQKLKPLLCNQNRWWGALPFAPNKPWEHNLMPTPLCSDADILTGRNVEWLSRIIRAAIQTVVEMEEETQ